MPHSMSQRHPRPRLYRVTVEHMEADQPQIVAYRSKPMLVDATSREEARSIAKRRFERMQKYPTNIVDYDVQELGDE